MFRHNGGSPAVKSYRSQLRNAIAQFLPHQGLPLLGDDRRVRWSDRLLTIMAIMICWNGSRTLLDRFAAGRQALVEMYVSRRRPGNSVEGFFKALVQRSGILLATLAQHWRGCLRQVAGKHWKTNGWILFGVDGSRFDCPRTLANEKHFGVTGKNNSGPQLLVTCLFHVGCGVLWSWMRGGITGDGEPTQFMNMLHLLPANAMLLADAGFAGYRMMAAMQQRGNSFLIRVGANRTLIRKLGYYVYENKQTVYLWPLEMQGRGGGKNRRFMPRNLSKVYPPLVLRLIELKDAKGRPVCLLTNVLDRKLLSDHAAENFYRKRWGIEVMWRDLKQTLSHCKLLSKTPQRVEVELDWALAGLWMLQLLGISQIVGRKRSPKDISTAATLRTLRTAMAAKPGRRQKLTEQLSIGLKDQYIRKGPKSRRPGPSKRGQQPPKRPEARMATTLEKRLILQIIEQKKRNSLAA